MIVMNLSETEAVERIIRMEKYGRCPRPASESDAYQLTSAARMNGSYSGNHIDVVYLGDGLFSIRSK